MIPLGHATFQVVGNKVGSKLRGFPRNLRPLLWGQGICPRRAALGPASPRALGKPGFSRFCGLPRRAISIIDLASWLGSLGRLGWTVMRPPGCCRAWLVPIPADGQEQIVSRRPHKPRTFHRRALGPIPECPPPARHIPICKFRRQVSPCPKYAARTARFPPRKSATKSTAG